MPPAKRKVSVTLDDDLVADLESEGGGLSARVNATLRADLQERRRQAALRAFLDRLEAEEGPLDTPQDKAEIARLMRLLGGEPGADLLEPDAGRQRAAG